jgi:hypothetical protein
MRKIAVAAAALALPLAFFSLSGAVRADTSWMFMTHAAFYSVETRQPSSLDPQVFVRDNAAAEETGPQAIHHVAGVRPARLADDDRTTPLYNADGKALGFNLGKWLGASGTVDVSAGIGGDRVHLGFVALIESARYTLYRRHFAPGGTSLTPLDGNGISNGFAASALGTAQLDVDVPAHLDRDDTIVLVYNSDGVARAADRGPAGVASHDQLVMQQRRAPGIYEAGIH